MPPCLLAYHANFGGSHDHAASRWAPRSTSISYGAENVFGRALVRRAGAGSAELGTDRRIGHGDQVKRNQRLHALLQATSSSVSNHGFGIRDSLWGNSRRAAQAVPVGFERDRPGLDLGASPAVASAPAGKSTYHAGASQHDAHVGVQISGPPASARVPRVPSKTIPPTRRAAARSAPAVAADAGEIQLLHVLADRPLLTETHVRRSISLLECAVKRPRRGAHARRRPSVCRDPEAFTSGQLVFPLIGLSFARAGVTRQATRDCSDRSCPATVHRLEGGSK